ncbi:hypothetical protein F4780DRAFT_470672 [Xylariomycetidae sp. FL0641]|nr:hypothetical protein F4780DRAFT_470672 [Xylariomycetidae sp. FL0641]
MGRLMDHTTLDPTNNLKIQHPETGCSMTVCTGKTPGGSTIGSSTRHHNESSCRCPDYIRDSAHGNAAEVKLKQAQAFFRSKHRIVTRAVDSFGANATLRQAGMDFSILLVAHGCAYQIALMKSIWGLPLREGDITVIVHPRMGVDGCDGITLFEPLTW